MVFKNHCDIIAEKLLKYANMAADGRLDPSEVSVARSGAAASIEDTREESRRSSASTRLPEDERSHRREWTIEKLSATQQHYQDILIDVAEQLSQQLRSLVRSCLDSNNTKLNQSTIDEITPMLYAFSWFVIHAAAALKPIGRSTQEQLILSGRAIIVTANEAVGFMLSVDEGHIGTCNDASLPQLKRHASRIVQGFLCFLQRLSAIEDILLAVPDTEIQNLGTNVDLTTDPMVNWTESALRRRSSARLFNGFIPERRRSSGKSLGEIIYPQVSSYARPQVYACWRRRSELYSTQCHQHSHNTEPQNDIEKSNDKAAVSLENRSKTPLAPIALTQLGVVPVAKPKRSSFWKRLRGLNFWRPYNIFIQYDKLYGRRLNEHGTGSLPEKLMCLDVHRCVIRMHANSATSTVVRIENANHSFFLQMSNDKASRFLKHLQSCGIFVVL